MGRNVVILGLTLVGILILVAWAWEDRQTAKLVAGSGCFLLAYVYGRLVLPRKGLFNGER